MSDKRIKSIFEKSPSYNPACTAISLLEKAGFEAFIVGGAVRDALMGLMSHDFDMATSASPDEMLKVFSNYKLLKHGIEFGTLTVLIDEVPIEITSYRGESGYKDQRHPDEVNFISSRDEDLKRRDFTINTMMFHPESGLYDPLNGEADLKNKIIKAVGDPVKRFEEDALRILRMLRFSVNLGFKIDEDALVASKPMLESLKKLSKERVYSEIEKTLSKEISWEQVDFITNEFFTLKIKNFEIEKELHIFEKAYLVFLFNDLVPDLSKYVLAKDFKKYFNYFLGLKDKSADEVKISFIKISDQTPFRGADLWRLWSLVEARQGLVSADESKIMAYPSKGLIKRLETLKAELSGAELGQAILEEKLEDLFT